MINCPNCGAPLATEQTKCDYCGTSYFDISSLDLQEGKPFFLKLKYGNMIITQLVKANDFNITMSSSSKDLYAYKGSQKIISYQMSPEIETNLSFTTMSSSGNMIRIDKI